MAEIDIIKGADNGNKPDTLRQMYPKVNRNFQNLNNEITGNKTDADSKLEAHKNSTSAHAAQNITYSGDVIGATNVKQALDNTKQTIDDLILGSGDSGPEVAAARGGHATLGDRLDSEHADVTAQLADLAYNVKSFGVTGDGVTDDTEAINNLITSINSGTVYFPKGTYLISKQGTRLLSFSGQQRGYGILILDKSDINFVFDAGAIIKMAVDDDHVFNGIWIEGSTRIKLLNPRFQGVGSTATRLLEEGVGISINRSEKVVVDGAHSVHLRGCARAYNSSCITIKNGFSTIYKNERATGHFALYSCVESGIDNCDSYGATLDGEIFIYGGGSLHCTIKNCRAHAYVYGDDAKEIFYDWGHGIVIDSGCRDCKLIGNYVYGFFYGLDSKNASEGTVIADNTAEKCKFGIAARTGEGAASPTNVLQVINNTIMPNGGNGNREPVLGSFTEPFAIALFDVYGGAIIDGNALYNSIDTQTESSDYDFLGVVIGLSEDASESTLGGFMVENNLFQWENRLAGLFGVNRKQAVYVTTQHKINNLSIRGNKFDLSQNGTITNIIEVYNVTGLAISNNEFSNAGATAPALIKTVSCKRVKVDGNIFGTHHGVFQAYSNDNLSFSGNSSLENVNSSAIPTVLLDNCLYVQVNNNLQTMESDVGTESIYLFTGNGTNWIMGQGNVLKLLNKNASNWYSTTATNHSFANNLIG